jgi:WD40 repeat protein
LDVSADGIVAGGTRKGTVFLWNPLTNKVLTSHSRAPFNPGFTPENVVFSVKFLKADTALISDFDALWVWNIETDKISRLTAWSRAANIQTINNDQFAFDQGNVVGIANCSLDSQRAVALPSRDDHVHAIAMSPDGNYLVIGHGGHWGDNDWVPSGPTSIEIYDFKKIHLAMELQDQMTLLRLGQHDMSRHPPVGPRLVDWK